MDERKELDHLRVGEREIQGSQPNKIVIFLLARSARLCLELNEEKVLFKLEDTRMLANDLLPGAAAAAAYIGVTPRAVYHMADQGLLPCIRKGRKLYFRKSELERAFSTNAAA